MRGLFLLLTVAACNYQPRAGAGDAQPPDGTETPDTGDAPLDSLVGPPPSACVEKWLAGTMVFTLPAFVEPPQVGTLTTAQDERDPFLSADGLHLYFARPIGGQVDVLVSNRNAITDPFTNAGVKTSLSDTLEDGKVTMTGDDLTAIVASRRANGSGGVDFWQARRSTAGSTQFPTLDQSFLAMVNNAGDQSDPHVTPDGMRLYYATGNPQTIVVAERTATLAAFSAPVPVAGVNGTTGDADPSLTADERVVLFTTNRSGGLGLTDLWYATRAERDQPFTAPINLTVLNSTDEDGDPHVSQDGCQVFWATKRDPNSNDYDLFFAKQ